MNGLKKLGRIYDKAEEWALVYTMVICVAIVFAQVVFRYVLNRSLSWSEELTKYLFVWLIWLGTSLAAREKEHIALSLVLDRLDFRTYHVFCILVKVIWGALCAFLLYNGIEVVAGMIDRGRTSFSMPWLQVWVVYLAIPFSQGVVLVRLLFQMGEDILALKRGPVDKTEGG